MDPVEMTSRFSEENQIQFAGSLDEDQQEENADRLDQIREILDLLPDREADFIHLYHFKQKRQQDIAAIFGVSQPTVCYRIKRGMRRIRFLLDLPEYDPTKITADFEGVLTDLDIQIIFLMYQTSCQSEVAKMLNLSQGKVRHRFLEAIKTMEKQDALLFGDYAETFRSISKNLNILREIRRSRMRPAASLVP